MGFVRRRNLVSLPRFVRLVFRSRIPVELGIRSKIQEEVR